MRKLVMRICAVAVGIVLAVPAFPAAFAENAAKSAEIDTSKITILKSLGIIDDAFCENASVSRIAFLKSVCAFMNGEKMSDLDAFTAGQASNITAAQTYTEFEPQRSITGYEAVKMLVALLGCEPMAQANGGYPKGYINEGKSLGIVPKGLLDSNLEVKDAIDMLYKVLDVNMMLPSGFIIPGRVTYTRADETVLFHYRGIKRIEGIMTANEYTGLNNPDIGAKGYLSIEETNYRTSLDGSEYNEYIGYPVIAYADDADFIVAIATDDEKYYNEISVMDKDITSISDGIDKASYDTGSKSNNINLSEILDVIYNGKAMPDYTKETLMPLNGSVKFIDNDNDKKYDVAIIKNYELYAVDYTSGKSKMMYNQYDKTQERALDLDDDKIIYSFLLDGEPIKVGKLTEGDIVNVAISQTGRDVLVEGIVMREQTAGKIGRVDTEDGILSIIDEDGNEAEYGINPLFLIENEQRHNKLKSGISVVCYFDSYGRIAYIQAKTEEFYAFVKSLKYNSDEEKIWIKYLDADNTWNKTDFAKKVRCNDYNVADQKAYDLLGGEDFSEKLMKLKLDSYGNVREITESNIIREGDKKFVESKNLTEYWYQQNFSFNWKAYLNDDAQVFMIPQTPSRSEEDYMATKPGQLRSGTSYTVRIYNANDFDVSDLAVVYNVPVSSSSSSSWFIVNKKTTEYDEIEDEVVTRVYSSVGDDETLSVAGRDETVLENINVGDVIIFNLDSKNRISAEPTKIFDINEGPIKESVSNMHGEYTRTAGFLRDVDAKNHKLRIDIGSEVTFNVPQGLSIKIYTVKDKKIIVGTIQDLKAGDFMIQNYYYSDLSQIIAIRY